QMGSKSAYVNKSGQIIINPQFKGAVPFNSGYAAVLNDDGKVGFINSKGEYVVYPMYDIDLGDVFEYLGASIQNSYGFPAQYTIDYHQGGKFKPYERLKEKKKAFAEAEAIRRAEEAAKAAEEAAAKAEEKAKEIAEAREMGTAEGEVLKDSRDGKEYKTLKIGKQTWLAGNLNYEAEGSVCYENKPENCEKYGRLYNWVAAVKICPSGWHLPSDDEWQKLLDFAGDDVAGKKLKAKNGWNGGGNGMDEYGFSALPGGFGEPDGKFSTAGGFGVWWSSSEADENDAYRRSMSFNYNNVRNNNLGKNYLISVRCLRD
ncbi:MAG: WG repeat-containing protein, partial [Candidatus Fibromonas sp.]|nr:WG repeat-containing protein [Candidatus Fibromonas sp.]